MEPSEVPSDTPSLKPSDFPSLEPSVVPTIGPSNPPTSSIKPSPSPSAAPVGSPVTVTTPPTGSPVVAPVAAPTTCVDSTLRLMILGANGTRIVRSCTWVANQDTATRCALSGVDQACPSTCGVCSTCADPTSGTTGLRFKFTKEGDEIDKTCEWVARKHTQSRCALTSNICRSTCGLCAASPTGSPVVAPAAAPTTCVDSTLRFMILGANGTRFVRSCTWVANQDTATRCALSGVDQECPSTCGVC